jgi:hypothetical protein
MKKFLAVVVLPAVGFALGVSWKETTAHAASGGGTPSGNGDLNGDGSIDISDAIYLLTSLFLGGNPPVTIECPPPAPKGLPATGQTKCYGIIEGTGWTEVPCDQAGCQGQDGQYAAGCPSEGRFVDNGDGTVTDTCTGLMWQQDTADVNADGKIDGRDRLVWCDALAYCENLSFAGHDDWRLPNVRELHSIIDYGRFAPAIDPVFGAVSDEWYWSSTSFFFLPDLAFIILFGSGVDGGGDRDGDPYYVRAVRIGP